MHFNVTVMHSFIEVGIVEIANPQILGLISLWQVGINQQIADSQISTKYCTTLSHNSPKSVFFQTIFLYKIE
jgi:hypothetical protein